MSRRRPDLAELEARIGYAFHDRGPLERALTHISALHGTPASGPHYQRLEFLGDRVLGLCVAEMLFRTFPKASEGELSRRLGHLVRRETCAEVAQEWDVGVHIRLGTGEMQTGLRKKEAILADVCESVLAAIFVDGGFASAQAVVERWFGPKMAEPGRAQRDPKSALQEWALARGRETPIYRQVDRSGPDHAPRFVVEAVIQGHEPTSGEGASKRMAEQAAAEAFLRREGMLGERPQ
jgi:ribonuclease III